MKTNTPLILILLVLFVTGCSKLTVANYDKLKSGMPYEEVVNILGTPASCDEVLGIKSCRWGDEQHKILVNFLGGKIVLTSAENIH